MVEEKLQRPAVQVMQSRQVEMCEEDAEVEKNTKSPAFRSPGEESALKSGGR